MDSVNFPQNDSFLRFAMMDAASTMSADRLRLRYIHAANSTGNGLEETPHFGLEKIDEIDAQDPTMLASMQAPLLGRD